MLNLDREIANGLFRLIETVRERLDAVSLRLDSVQQMAENTDAMLEEIAAKAIENRNRLDRLEGDGK